MFTVIILSRAAKSIFEKCKTFFEPFVDSGEIAFCEWNESPKAVTVDKALPDLRRVIQGKPAWRAIVVDHAAGEVDAMRDPENPFDFRGNDDIALSLTDSPFSLVRIAHQLLGYPSLTAQAFRPVIRYRVSASQLLESGRAEQTWAPDWSALELAPGEREEDAAARAVASKLRELTTVHSDVRVQYEEVEYDEEAVRTHRELSERYRMKEVHPSEVLFISTRAPVAADAQSELRRAWRMESEQNTSRFVPRNDYPAATRFLVYDLLNPQNSGYRQDELRFWISVLTIAVNTLPASTLQADRVYRLGVEFSNVGLGDLLSGHMSNLTALREHLDSRIRRPERPPEIDVKDLLREENVHVRFDRLGGGELSVRTSGYGLAADLPRSEQAAWSEEFDDLQVSASQFVRKPRRVLARAVYDARTTYRGYLGTDHVLSDIDREEIEEELVKRVSTLTLPATTGILDRERLATLLGDQRRRVAGYIAQRMRIGTIGLASLVVLAVWSATFVPYLMQAARQSTNSLLWSVFLVAAVVLVLAAVGTVTLLLMRRTLIRLLRETNSVMRAFVVDVNGSASVFGEYLSHLATYMYARSVLIGSGRLNERDREQLRRYTAIRNRAERMIEAERAIIMSLGQPVNVRRAPAAVASLDVDDPRDVDSFFQLPIGDRRAAVNESGEFVRAPYDFVRRLHIERVRLFETPAAGGTFR
ncbi:hypothetical protein [Microbacterium sp.]|uniref:hypothetical protein n=1 Tax=Microbacterium sp. TaxID=51671 RepID=UPI0037C9C153